MTRFRYWRKMTWTILLAGTAMAAWVVIGGFGLLPIAVSVVVLGLLGTLSFLTQPLWRQGRGFSLNRWEPPEIPFKTRVKPLAVRADADPRR